MKDCTDCKHFYVEKTLIQCIPLLICRCKLRKSFYGYLKNLDICEEFKEWEND